MVYKVLSVAVGVAFAAMAVMFTVCLGYTLATPAVKAGIDQIRTGVQDMVGGAMEQMDTGWLPDFSGLADGAAEALDSVVSVVSGDSSELAMFASEQQGRTYLAWKEPVANPTTKVLGSISVDYAAIEGVAAGSSSAIDALLRSDESSLAGMGVLAARYAATADANTVPTGLPDAARVQMVQANIAAGDFGRAMVDLADAARRVKNGDPSASADLMAAASAGMTALTSFNAFVEEAERVLRG